MGGGGGSSEKRNTIDLTKLTEAADARLRELARTGTRVLFVCENEDRRSLESHLARSSTAFPPDKYVLHDENSSQSAFEEVKRSSVVVAYTNVAIQTTYLDAVAEAALAAKKQGIHVRGTSDATIPAKIVAYRWPSMTWERLVAMFGG